MRKLHVIIVLLCCLSSCNKENSSKWTEINVLATNYLSGEPFNEADFFITEARNVWPWKVNTLVYVQLENGESTFGFKAKNSVWRYAYKLDYELEKYWCLLGETSDIEIETGIDYDLYFEFVEMGNWIFNVTNTACESSADKVTINIVSEYETLGLRSVPFDEEIAGGCITSAFLYERKVPAGNYYVQYEVEKLSGTTFHTDTVFIQPGTTTNYTLSF